MDNIDWKKKAEFYKKQLDELKVSRFALLDELKKKDNQIKKEISKRHSYYYKIKEFKKQVYTLLNNKLDDIDIYE